MIRSVLARFFRRTAPLHTGDALLVAFSGGPDSTALLWGLRQLLDDRDIDLHAAHLDHALDQESAARARRAAELAEAIGVPFHTERLSPPPRRPAGGIEDWARRERYRFLERSRLRLGARYLVTGHHRDDQIETVLLRWLMGSGLEGLAAMETRRGSLLRPLLELDRASLRTSLEATALEPVEDPTNDDPSRPRNRIRKHLVPHLLRSDPEAADRLVRLAAASRRLSGRLEDRLRERLAPRREPRGASLDLEALRTLPPAVLPFALSLLAREAGRPYPPGRPARRELARQLAAGRRIGCDCGDGWRFTAQRGRLRLGRPQTEVGAFAYTLSVPGEVAIPPLGLRLRLAREPFAPWMLEGRPERAALALPEPWRGSLSVRNRRPGDRVRPLGCRYTRRLKEVLIDRGVPRRRRDALPLLCRGERILWVPGVTIDDDLRLSGEKHPWVARLEPLGD